MTRSVAERLTAAVESGDVDALRSVCHVDATFWNTFLDRDLTLADVCALRAAERAVAPDLALTDIRRTQTPSGFVQQMTVRGRLTDGSAFEAPVCLVVEVRDGLVARVEEYVDGRRIEPLARLASPATASAAGPSNTGGR